MKTFEIHPHEFSSSGIAISWAIRSANYWSKSKGLRSTERRLVKKFFGKRIIHSRAEAEAFHDAHGGEL